MQDDYIVALLDMFTLLMIYLLYYPQSEEGTGSLCFAAATNFAGLARSGDPAHQGWIKLKFISDAAASMNGLHYHCK